VNEVLLQVVFVILVLEKLNYVKLEANEQFRTVSPNEFAIDGSYSLKLSETFSMAVAGRYIRSNLKVITDTGDASAANSFAIDVAGFYQSEELAYNEFNGRWSWI
jgi:hypothetical protein